MRRRTFCTAVGAGATGLLSNPSTARDTTDPPTVTTAGHFERDWGGPHRVEGIGPTAYDTRGQVPGLDTPTTTDVTIFVPGFRAGEVPGSSAGSTDAIRTALSSRGYDGSVVRYAWDMPAHVWEWTDGQSIARWNGPKLAAVTRDLLAETLDATIRYVGHSLGASVVVSALQTLADADWKRPVSTVSLLGAAVPRATLLRSDASMAELTAGAAWIDNYWSSSDQLLDRAVPTTERTVPLGLTGLDRSPPDSYTDHPVEIESHFDYLDPAADWFDTFVDGW